MTAENGKQLKRRWRADKAISFAAANLAAVLISFFSGGISNVLLDNLDNLAKFGGEGVTLITQLHWLILFTGVVLFFCLLSVALEVWSVSGFFGSVFRIPTWTELRNFGDQKIAKISYFALVGIPIVVSFLIENPFHFAVFVNVQVPLNLKISFFVAFFFSLALITFGVGCPKEFMKTPRPFEGSKNVNLVFGNAERSVVNVLQGESDFFDDVLDKSKLVLRTLCWTFYFLGLSYSTVLLFRSARMVLMA